MHVSDLDHALSCLTREDPSLRVSMNQETRQTVLSGMGELHLEIIHDRLKDRLFPWEAYRWHIEKPFRGSYKKRWV